MSRVFINCTSSGGRIIYEACYQMRWWWPLVLDDIKKGLNKFMEDRSVTGQNGCVTSSFQRLQTFWPSLTSRMSSTGRTVWRRVGCFMPTAQVLLCFYNHLEKLCVPARWKNGLLRLALLPWSLWISNAQNKYIYRMEIKPSWQNSCQIYLVLSCPNGSFKLNFSDIWSTAINIFVLKSKEGREAFLQCEMGRNFAGKQKNTADQNYTGVAPSLRTTIKNHQFAKMDFSWNTS